MPVISLSLENIQIFIPQEVQTTFIMCSSDYKQNPQVEARKAKTQQMYELSLSGLDLRLLFMVTGAYYERGL